MIHFNRPHMTGMETEYIRQAVEGGKISGNGEFTHRCQDFFERRYGFGKCLLTTSGTDALEMAALLSGVGPGDEVIVPSYTFVSTALAFVRCGAKVVFADSRADEPNLDAAKVEALITPRTKVIVPVHYAGCACDMGAIMEIAGRHGLLVVEDAAQAIDSFYLGQGSARPLGSIGHFGCFSFHETKNVISGEGGMLTVNDDRFARRAEIIWEKGTNRAEFFRGEVNRYGWVDVGSSFLPTEVVSAFLWAQLEHLDEIQAERQRLWDRYREELTAVRRETGNAFALPRIPDWTTNNAHMFYLLFPDLARRTDFIAKMRAQDVLTVFHYLPLHSSAYYRDRHDGRELPNCDRYADTLVRLPLYCGLGPDQDRVIAAVRRALA
ncbi:MAG: dTDP-4-amino-4,6-dideoxygalactose transaminase [Kiritimatiellia bacterium]